MSSEVAQHSPEGSVDASEESSIVAAGTGLHAVAEASASLAEVSHPTVFGAAGEVAAQRKGWTVGSRFWALNASHLLIDVYPIFFVSLMILLKERLGLTGAQIAIIFATGPVVSGLPQIFFAWASDRLDTRFCGWFGLVLGAVCISSIGLAPNFWWLWGLQIAGMLGTGMFHPIGAALAGQMGGALRPAGSGGRAWGVGIFYTAGMVGGFIGSLACTRMSNAFGVSSLIWFAPPALLMAAVLFSAIHRLPHRHGNHHELRSAVSREEARRSIFAVTLLFVGNVLRFTVNTGLPVLFFVWAERRMNGDIGRATILNGSLLAAMTLGMGVFGLTARRWSPAGREKGPMLTLTLVGAALVALTGYTGTHLGVGFMYIMAAFSAMGFSAVIPTTISIAQRLLPGRTGLASGLMLGTAWSISSTAPYLARYMFGGVSIADAHQLDSSRIDLVFVGFASLLLISAMLTWAIPSDLLKRIGQHR